MFSMNKGGSIAREFDTLIDDETPSDTWAAMWDLCEDATQVATVKATLNLNFITHTSAEQCWNM